MASGLDLDHVMSALEEAGTEQAIKTCRNHGVSSPCLGVRYADLYKLQKKIKCDHPLALELWETGIHDARVLAALILDPELLDFETLELWVDALSDWWLTMDLARGAATSSKAKEFAAKWKDDPREFPGQFAWSIYAHLGSEADRLPDGEALNLIVQVEREIHGRANRVRYSMGSAMIAFGTRENLRDRVLAAADIIGPISVDHGKTNCKTPQIRPGIEQILAYQARKRNS